MGFGCKECQLDFKTEKLLASHHSLVHSNNQELEANVPRIGHIFALREDNQIETQFTVCQIPKSSKNRCPEKPLVFLKFAYLLNSHNSSLHSDIQKPQAKFNLLQVKIILLPQIEHVFSFQEEEPKEHQANKNKLAMFLSCMNREKNFLIATN